MTSNNMTVGLLFTVLDRATAPIRRINETVGNTGKLLETAAFKGVRLNTGIERLSTGASIASRVAAGISKIGVAAERSTAKLELLRKKTEKIGTYTEKLAGIGVPMVAGGAIVGAGLGLSEVPGAAISAEHALRSLGNVGDLTNSQLSKMNKGILATSRQVNQTQKELIEGMNVLVAAGLNPEIATNFLPVIGKTATATTAAVTDVSKTAFAAYDNLKVPVSRLGQTMDILSLAGKEGRFELKDMATYFPMLTAGAQALGAKGVGSVAQIGAALQIAMKGAADPSSAANNFQNFLQKITSKETVKNFEKFGVNVESELNKALKTGADPFEHMINLIQKTTGGNKFKLSELFGDMQVTNFLNPMMQNMGEYRRIRDKALTAQGVVDKDFGNMMGTTVEQWKQLKITVASFAIPALAGPLSLINTVLKKVSSNALLAKTAIYGVGAMLIGGGLLTSLAGFGMAVPKALEGMATLGKAASWTTGRLLATKGGAVARGPLGEIITVAPAVGSKLTALGNVFSGGFSAGIKTAIVAMRAFTVSLLTNPIGWIALAIGVAALVIYKYWGPISGFFRGLWTGLKSSLKGLEPAWDIFKRVAPILFPILIPLKWIFNLVKALFKPVDDVGGKAENMGLRFGKAIGRILSSVLQLPARMLTAGANIIDSLFKGMMSKIEKPINTMKGLATRLRGFLPFSPAKEGALRDINRIRLVETIAEGIKPQPMVQAMKMATAATMIAAMPVGASMTPPAGHQVQLVQQAVKGAEVTAPAALVQPVNQVLQRAAIPSVGNQVQLIHQAVKAAEIAPPAALVQPVNQVLQRAAIPAVGNQVQLIQQAVKRAQLPQLADATQQINQVPAPTPQRPAVASLARPISAGQGSGGITIHFAPQITVQGGGDPAAVKGAVMEASKVSLAELERMIERIMAQKQRTKF